MGFWILPRDKENETSKYQYERLTNEKTNEEIVRKGSLYFLSISTRGGGSQYYEITKDEYNKLKENWDSINVASRGIMGVYEY